MENLKEKNSDEADEVKEKLRTVLQRLDEAELQRCLWAFRKLAVVASGSNFASLPKFL